ncbi:hypothetical protein Tco_0829278 [Tanacetum coccineum]
MVEQGVPALPTLPFITSSVTASPLEEGGDHTDSVTGPSLRTIGPSARFVVLSDSSHHSGAKSADPEVDSLVRSAVPVMTEATTVTTIAPTVAIPADVGKDKSVSHPSIFGSSSSSEKTDRAGLEEVYVPEWTVTKGFELNDERLCVNMNDHFTPPAFFKNVRGIEHEQLFTEFNVSVARNLSLSSEDKEIEDLKSQLLKAKEEYVAVTQLRAWVSSLEAIEGSLRGEVASAKEHSGLLDEQECNSLKLKVTGLESTIAEKDHELSDLGASSSSLKLVAEIDADFTRVSSAFRKFPSAPPQLRCGRRWLLTHGRRQSCVKCLKSNEQAGRCLTDLEAYIPSAEDDFNSTTRDLRDLDFPLLKELSDKKDASTWDIMDLLRLDDTVAETLGSQALSVALDICRGRVEKMEKNLIERLPFLKDVFVSIDDPLSAEALIEPPAEVPSTNVLSTVVIIPHAEPSVSVEDYDKPDSSDVVPENATLGSESEGRIDASAGGGLTFSQLDDEARDAVL